ncbi:hypothetical protein QUF73_24835 [Cytobacillus sp. NJ13]|nr:hypothetical protein [Cytobacillus sp. NJ13]
MKKGTTTVNECRLIEIIEFLMLKEGSKLKEVDLKYKEDGKLFVKALFKKDKRTWRFRGEFKIDNIENLTLSEFYTVVYEQCQKHGVDRKKEKKDIQMKKLQAIQEGSN